VPGHDLVSLAKPHPPAGPVQGVGAVKEELHGP
jgi:hypothetical protein